LLGKYNNFFDFFKYLLEPSHALDSLINGENLEKFEDLFLTFRPLHSFIEKLGMITKKAQLLPYIVNNYTQFPVNVYTMFGVYIIDYGIYGSFIIIFIIGFWSGIIEKMSFIFRENKMMKIIYSLNLTCLTLGCFYDYYFSSGFVWITVILCFTVIFYPRKNKTLTLE
jgi:oligosaccharide repeat unit polymerase